MPKLKPKIPAIDLPMLPVFNTPDTPLVSTTQEYIPIADIADGLVLFKNGGAALVMESTSLNFGLLSEREQEAVIASYAGLVNSLSFHIQVVVRSQRKDITKYIARLDTQMGKIENPKLKSLMGGYRAFITETIKKKNVLGKRFFLVIPFSPVELGLGNSAKSLFGKQGGPIPYSREYVLKKVKISLLPKRDHLSRQFARLGLTLRQLTNEELIALYYDIYNPDIEAVRERGEMAVQTENNDGHN